MTPRPTLFQPPTLRAALFAAAALAIIVGSSGCSRLEAVLPLPVAASPSATAETAARPTPVPTPTATPAPTAPASAPRALRAGSVALIIGDSFTEGYGASDPEHSWAHLAAASLDWDATIDGVGGTGFTKASATDGRDGVDFLSRIEAMGADSTDYDVVVLQGGLNDVIAPTATEATNVSRTVASARATWPSAVIVVFGPTAPLASTTYRDYLDPIREAALEAGAIYVDPESPSPWINARNTAAFDLGDGLHLNDAGYAYLAARFVAAIEQLR